MKKPILIGAAIALVVLAITDVYLEIANPNACTIHNPINLIAVFLAGFVFLQVIVQLFPLDTPEWVLMLCGNILALCFYMALIVAGAAWATRHKARKRNVEPEDR